MPGDSSPSPPTPNSTSHGRSPIRPATPGRFERAQLQLDYGEWLRRQRRINDAKPLLATALDTLRQLGAAPWTRRAESELRACGVTVQDRPTSPATLDQLTPQQREIADRLFLSPKTVASHLYRSYPQLGITGRHRLRDLIDIDQHGTPPTGGENLDP